MKNSLDAFRPKTPIWNTQGKSSGEKALDFYFTRISKCFPVQNRVGPGILFIRMLESWPWWKDQPELWKLKSWAEFPGALLSSGSAPVLSGSEQLCVLYPTLILVWSWGPWLTELHPNCAGRWLWRKRCPISGGPTTTTGRSTSSSSRMTSSWCSLTSWCHPAIMHRWVSWWVLA